MKRLQVLVLAVNQDVGEENNSIRLSSKNLREIGFEPQIVHVIKSLKLETLQKDTAVTLCISAAECEKYFTDETIIQNFPNLRILRISGNTRGALATACLAVDFLNLDEPLLIVNGDQVLEEGLHEFIFDFEESGCAAAVLTFYNTHPRWSYVIEEEGEIIEFAEKRPISNKATCGYYIFRSGDLFLFAASKSFLKRETIKESFFVAPALNELILSGERVKAFDVDSSKYHSLSTTLDTENYRRILRGSANS